jgi:hypothetical protein
LKSLRLPSLKRAAARARPFKRGVVEARAEEGAEARVEKGVEAGADEMAEEKEAPTGSNSGDSRR